MSSDLKEILMYSLGGIIVTGFFVIVGFKVWHGTDAQLEIGALIGAFSGVVGYFFGSSKGSADKTAIMKGGK